MSVPRQALDRGRKWRATGLSRAHWGAVVCGQLGPGRAAAFPLGELGFWGLGPAGGRCAACPAIPAGRDWLTLLDAGGETGEVLSDAAELGLDHRHDRLGEFYPGLGDDGLDQHQHKDAEPICRGEGGGVFHTLKLVWMAPPGQAKKRRRGGNFRRRLGAPGRAAVRHV